VGTSDSNIVITLVTVAGCEPCTATSKLVARFVADNLSCGISLRLVDAETDAKEVVRTGALIHPTMILEVDGQERAHLRTVARPVLRSMSSHDNPSASLTRNPS